MSITSNTYGDGLKKLELENRKEYRDTGKWHSSLTPSTGIVMPSTSSLTGIALNPVWHSIGSWSYGTGAIWNPGQLAPGTVNLRLGAVRRLAYEAADCGLLSSDLAAGIRRGKGVKKRGVRLGNWLTV